MHDEKNENFQENYPNYSPTRISARSAVIIVRAFILKLIVI
jgi:hypothetical protein